MSNDIDGIGLATVDLMANITHEVHDLSLRPVGYGGYSDIYKAVWRSPYGDMQVAVKVIRTLPMPPGLDNMPRVRAKWCG
ncbi:hypothetical protein EXIGLDRAFT_198343 [Exidia glandulosa HHB12029]|uniref:Protein kinase domain-containing protein n=1 Tax=Exidia glandulosa HHB12029 TaxID=1314781 RepID=A0A165MX53_EXIGL|nr:hypothetical protein EXIGLDRAFT_198343 [Exidia glandulosa HHB12029]